MTDQHEEATGADATDGEPSGYTPLDELQGPSVVSSVRMASSNDTPEEAESAAATFILATMGQDEHVEPEGWSDYSDDDNYEAKRSMGGEGAFFADMSVFPHPDNKDEEEDAPNGYAPLSMSGGPDEDGGGDDNGDNSKAETEEFDYRAIADQALRALDDEYLSTVQMQQEQEVPTVAVNNVDDINNNEEEEEVCDQAESTADADEATPLPSQAKELPPIDNEAVRKAMEAMRLKSPDLANTLDAGAEQRLDAKYRLSLAPSLVPDVHGIIPPAPLKAFRKMTAKAVTASANLSRSATISEAIVRCLPHMLLPNQDKEQKSNLVIHIVGSDHVECQSEETVRAAVGPLVRWVESACSSNVSSIEIELSGPNVPVAAERRGVTDLSSTSNGGLQSATARCVNCVYHDYLQSKRRRTPDLAIAFDAGIWGYDEWRPTLEAMCNHNSAIPFVITGYTVQEVEDDAEVVTEVATNAKAYCLWSPEINPFGSRKKRETSSAARGREYRENGAWQAWRLGGTG